MAGELIREVKLRAKFDTESLVSASNEIQKFFDKYNDKKTSKISLFDLRSTINNLSAFKRAMDKYRVDSPELMSNGVFRGLLDSLDEFVDKFDSITARFDNGKWLSGFKDIEKAVNFDRLSVMAGGFSERLDYLRKQSDDIVDSLKRTKGLMSWDNDWTEGNFDEDQLNSRIDLLHKLIKTQKELEDFHGGKLPADTFHSERRTSDLEYMLSEWKEDLDEMQRYNISTTDLLAERRRIIEDAQSTLWSSRKQNMAKGHYDDKEQYEEDLQNLRSYIQTKEELLQRLNDNQYSLFYGDDDFERYVQNTKGEIESYRRYLNELENFKSQGIDFTEVVTALNEIKQAIREIKDAFGPLTQAFANEDSAISKMVNANVEDLNRLQEKFEQVFRDIQTLSEKDFSSQTTNVVQQTINAPGGVLKAQRAELKELVKMLAQYQSAISRLNSQSNIFKKIGLSSRGQMDFFSFDANEILEGLRKATTAGKLDGLSDVLEDYKTTIIQIAKEINKIASGTVNLDPLQNLKKKDPEILNLGQTTSNVDGILTEVKSIRDKIDLEIQDIRASFENIFKFDSLNPNYDNITSITDKIYQQFVELQNKIKALDFKIEVPDMNGVAEAIKVIKQEGNAAEGATPKKDDFTAANQKLASSMKETGSVGKVAADGIKAEEESAKEAAKSVEKSIQKIRASQRTLEDEYKRLYGGKGKVNANLASNFNKVLEAAGLDASSIKYTFGAKSYKDKDGNVIDYDYVRFLADCTDAAGKAKTETREYEVATGALIKKMASFKDVKDTFDIAQEVATANSKVAELEKRMGSFKINLEGVKAAAGSIVDETTLDIFEKKLDSANQKLKELKATLKSTHSLDPVTNAESMMSNLDTTVKKFKTDIKKFANVEGFGQLGTHLTNISTKLEAYKTATDGMKKAQIVQGVNQEIAKFNAQLDLVKSKHTEENRVLREQQQEYNKLIGLQNKLYVDKVQLAKAEYGSANEQILQGRVQARQEEYDETMKAIAGTENYNAVKKKEIQLEEELRIVAEERRKQEEELAWTQREREENSRIEKETEAAYKERAEAIKAETAAEKELIAARKESDAFYNQEEKTRKAQEDAAWTEYRAEQEAAAEKERQINLAFSQKAAQEAAEAERELAQARKEADDYFSAVEKQEKKEEETRKVKELNALYRERNTIITAIIKYNNKAETLKTDKAIQRAKDQLALEIQRLAAIDEEIDKYGELINLSKLEQQNDRLTGRLRDSNVMNAITKEQKKDIEDVNRLLTRRQEVHDKILQLQKQLNGAKGDKERKAIQKELDGQNAIYRALTKNLAVYKDIVLQRKVTEQDSKFGEQDGWNKAQQNISAAASADKAKLEDQKQDYKDILNLVEQLFEAQIALHKINIDPTDKVHTAEREKEIKQVKELSMLLKDIYGVDIKNLMGSFDKNALLTQEQKNGLLEKERNYKKEIVDLTAEAADKAADLARKEAERQQKETDSKNQNYGKKDFNRLEQFSDSMHASIRELQNGGHVSTTLTNLVAEFDEAYTKIEAMRKQFNDNPVSVTPERKTQFKDDIRHAENLRQKITEIFKESQKLNKIGQLISTDDKDVSNLEDLRGAMVAFANSALDGEVRITGFNEKGTEMYVALTKAGGAVENITVALNQSVGRLQAFSTGTSKVTNELALLKSQAVSGAKRLATMYLSFHDLLRYARKGVGYVKEIDLAMTELKKVTDETDASYKQFLDDASGTAAIIGSTISDFTEATATFARLGYSMEESASMAETAIIYKNVADGLDSVEESSESIISTMKAFGIEANDTMSIIDRFNAVGNNFAITSAGIGEALQRSASALYSAGNTIDESVALVTAANSVIQNPEQVGEMLADYKVA